MFFYVYLQVVPLEDTTNKDNTKKIIEKKLKRSKSESTHNRRAANKTVNDNNEPKPPRRRFFSRKSGKVKKETSPNEENSTKDNTLRKTQSFNDHSTRSLPPPPDYEQSTTKDITPLPTTVTWKGEHQFYPTNTTIDLTNPEFENEDDYDDEEEMSVPLLVTVFVIPLYLTLGAVLFSIWEKWSFLDSFYFCFITLTTIGFGDFVPGIALQAKAEKEKLISAAVYILFGLVLIAMCVNLMKEKLSQRVKRVAHKLGKF
jgi:hypothetical protein